MNKTLLVSLIVIAVIASILLSFIISEPETKTSDLPDIVDIGILFPLTGDLASHGEEDRIAALLAIDDFNLYLQENDKSWRINGIVEDTQTSPVIALEKLTSLHAKDVNVIVGPATSSNIRNIIGYATANNIILISCCSTAPSLAIPDDNVYRMVPDDNKQGPAIAELMKSRGIEMIVPVWRADTWGDGLKEATINSFTENNQADEGIRYNPESPEFSASTSLLAEKVRGYVEEYGADKVGVLLIGFSESLQFMQSASTHDILNDVSWFGSDANTNEQKIVDDPIGLKFAQDVDFTTLQFAAATNTITDRVENHIKEKLGRSPSVYAYSSYDAVFIAGLAIDTAQSTETDKIKENIISVANNHVGAVGSTALNDAGDLAAEDYAVWAIRDGVWVVLDLSES